MLDVRRLRTDLDDVLGALARRGDSSIVEDARRAAGLDDELRRLNAERDSLRARIRALSNEIGVLHREGRGDQAGELRDESRALGAQEKELDGRAALLGDDLRSLLLLIPNVPHSSVPDGADDADNPVSRTGGPSPDTFTDAQRVPHWEIGERLGILDGARAAKISGSMFAMPRAAGATLARALTQFGLDRNADLYEEVRPPSLVLPETLMATGQLPKFADEAYHLERDDLWAIPTGEAPLTSMHRGEILEHDELPIRYMAATPCYRREAGAAGRDTRGMLRAHEFDKVEIMTLASADRALELFDEMLTRAIGSVDALGLSWRTVDICAGDLGQGHHLSTDVEVYAPGADAWLEVSSVSWFGDYQARRADIRVRREGGSGTELVHTLNGSALAVPRVWAALLETHRSDDGTVEIPEPLRPYMRGLTRIEPRR